MPIPELPGYAAPPPFQYGDYAPAPAFSYQDYTPAEPYAAFKAPSVEQALVDPSYQWRKQQGEQSLQNWAAARGTLNDSGTAKALLDYGGNAASQEYRSIWDRDFNAYGANRDTYNMNEGNRFKTYATNRAGALDTFNLNEGNRANAYAMNRAGAVDAYTRNYQTQFVDPYKFSYQAALDKFAPQLEAYRTNAAYTQHQSDMDYANAWNQYLNQWNQWKDRRDTAINLAGF
ncbi:MAG TPA: hypothetical protein VGQ19_19555 [Burkholderiales bacterium]|nr:hypothetical protein [Burkholderiales bacterium]